MEDLKSIVAEVQAKIIAAPEHSRAQVFAEALAGIWGEDVGKAMGVLNLSRSTVFEHHHASREYVEKQYLTRQLHEWLYELILTKGVDVDVALTQASELFEVTLEYLNESRNNVHAVGRMKEVVKVFDEHEIQKGMIKRGIVTRKELQNHKTPTGQFSRLLKGVKLYNTVAGIEGRLDVAESDVKTSKAAISIVQENVTLLTAILDQGISTGRKIQICKDNGLTQAVAADTIGVSISTVKRGWNT